MNDADDDEELFHVPIDGVLDLHLFRPEEVTELVGDYLDACLEEGIFEVRIIHGKGRGTLRDIVHSALGRRDDVESHRPAPPERGGWGATLVDLRRPPDQRPDS